jgi:hypothetical protein
MSFVPTDLLFHIDRIPYLFQFRMERMPGEAGAIAGAAMRWLDTRRDAPTW